MILTFHPDMKNFPAQFQTQTPKDVKFIGYWHSVIIDPQSLQIVRTASGFERYEDQIGIGKLPLPSDYVDLQWDSKERERVAAYVSGGMIWESWRGNSFCRFGCKHLSGYRDLTDETYVWPEAFEHYIRMHGVRPPQEFIDHVLSKGKNQ